MNIAKYIFITIVSIVVLFLICVSHEIYVYIAEPEHTMEVTYILYTPSGPVERISKLRVRGKDCRTRHMTECGSNRLYLISKPVKHKFWFSPDIYNTVYEGTLYVETKSIRILN